MTAHQHAAQVRKEWAEALAKGVVGLSKACEMAASGHKDAKYLKKLRMRDVIASTPQWDKSTAEEALMYYGLKKDETVASLRSSDHKIEKVEKIMASSSERWGSMPEVPKGWPWRGKLPALTKALSSKDEDHSP